MSAPQSLIKSVLQINFGIPAALNTDTVGTDAITGVTEFTPKTQNVIKDVRMAVDAAAGLNFTLLTRRLDEKEKPSVLLQILLLLMSANLLLLAMMGWFSTLDFFNLWSNN